MFIHKYKTIKLNKTFVLRVFHHLMFQLKFSRRFEAKLSNFPFCEYFPLFIRFFLFREKNVADCRKVYRADPAGNDG